MKNISAACDQWEDATPHGTGEQRNIVAARIKACAQHKSSSLDLNSLGLTGGPDLQALLRSLTDLKSLDLNNNDLME